MLTNRISSSQSIDPILEKEIADKRHQLEFYLDWENSYWLQRAKIKWNIEGERNTKYFHTMVSKRKMRGIISQLCKKMMVLGLMINLNCCKWFKIILSTFLLRITLLPLIP